MQLGSFQEREDAPWEIARFERLWLAAIAVSVVISIWMFDLSVQIYGAYVAAVVNILHFGAAYVLMIFCSRRRSNVARWLLAVPFNLLIVVYDILRFADMIDRSPMQYFALLRLGLMAAATYMLFTRYSRAWFAGRPPPHLDPNQNQTLI